MTAYPEIAMNESNNEQAYREEAERLKKLPPADRAEIIALHRAVADNPKVPKGDRREARDRADALDRLLRRKPSKSKKKQ